MVTDGAVLSTVKVFPACDPRALPAASKPFMVMTAAPSWPEGTYSEYLQTELSHMEDMSAADMSLPVPA